MEEAKISRDSQPATAPSLTSSLNRFRKQKLFCDTVVSAIDGAKLDAHMCVLAAACPPLLASFPPSPDICYVIPTKISAKVLNHVLSFVYTGRSEEGADREMFREGCRLLGVSSNHGSDWSDRLQKTLSSFQKESIYCDLRFHLENSSDPQSSFSAHACVACAGNPDLETLITESQTPVSDVCVSVPVTDVSHLLQCWYSANPTAYRFLVSPRLLNSARETAKIVNGAEEAASLAMAREEDAQSVNAALPPAPSVCKVKEFEPNSPNRSVGTPETTLATLQPVQPPSHEKCVEGEVEATSNKTASLPPKAADVNSLEPAQIDRLFVTAIHNNNNNNSGMKTANAKDSSAKEDCVPKLSPSVTVPPSVKTAPILMPPFPMIANAPFWSHLSEKSQENSAIDLTTKMAASDTTAQKDATPQRATDKSKGGKESRSSPKPNMLQPVPGLKNIPGLPVPPNLPAPYPGLLQPVYTSTGQIQMVQLLPVQYANLMCWPQVPPMVMKPEAVSVLDSSKRSVPKTAKLSPNANTVKPDETPKLSSPTNELIPKISSPTNALTPKLCSPTNAPTPESSPTSSLVKVSYPGYVDTKEVAEQVIRDLKKYCIPQAVFAQVVLGRTQGTLSDLLRKPKPWSKLKSGRETFARMYHWLQIPENTRIVGLKNAADALDTGQLRHKRKSSSDEGNTPTTKDTDGEPTSSQPKKSRNVFTPLQRDTLTAIFKETRRPTKLMQKMIAEQLDLKLSTVANFFMNARRRSPEMYMEDTDSENAQNRDSRGSVDSDQTKLQSINQHLTAYHPTDALKPNQ